MLNANLMDIQKFLLALRKSIYLLLSLQNNPPNHSRKNSVSKKLRDKRLKEYIYLNHFLALNNLKPDKIISGKDDGKEPDFTLVFNHKLIGVELTTLPRLHERLSCDFLLWQKWYWSFKKQLSLGHTKKYDPHHQHLHYHQHFFYHSHHHYSSNFNNFLTPPKKNQFINNKQSLHHSNTTKDSSPATKTPDCIYSSSHHNSTFLNFAKKIADTIPPSQSYFINPTHFDSPKPLINHSYIEQSDIDAVISKKGNKVEAYKTRRDLDELWLLVHANQKHPNMQLAMPNQHLFHNTHFDKMWLTIFPTKTCYEVTKEPDSTP